MVRLTCGDRSGIPPGGLALARAERRAKEEGLRVFYEPEQECYRDVYGDDPPDGAEFSWAAVYSEADADKIERTGKERGCVPLASLGFVETALATRAMVRVQEAELFAEALATLDAERDASATEQAAELAARATFAGPGTQS